MITSTRYDWMLMNNTSHNISIEGKIETLTRQAAIERAYACFEEALQYLFLAGVDPHAQLASG